MLKINPEITMPISEAVNDVLECCGYHLTKQELLHLEYHRTEQGTRYRLTFNYGLNILAQRLPAGEPDDCFGWQIDYTFRSNVAMKDLQILDILQAWGYIDYHKLKEYRDMVRTAFLMRRIHNSDRALVQVR